MSPDLLNELLCLITALRHVLEDSPPLDREELESRLELQGAKPVTISTSHEERAAGLDYCETDVTALAKLLPAMPPKLDLKHALLRGRYSSPAVSAMQHDGVPIDMATLGFVLDHWEGIIDELIARIDVAYGVYEGRTFKEKRFEDYLARHRIPWHERTAHGHLKLDGDTFTEVAKTFPILEPLRNLRHSLGEMRLNELPVGHDGRNRVMLGQFAARTERNQPSSSKFIFSPGVWLRGFIAPPPGHKTMGLSEDSRQTALAELERMGLIRVSPTSRRARLGLR